MMAPPLRILLADDHPALRMGLAELIGSQPDMKVVGQAADGHEALAACRALDPDIILLDLVMPGLSGIEAIHQLGRANARVRIIVLTTFALDEDIYRAMNSGAHAYLLKDASIKEITGTIRSVAEGKKILPPGLALRLKSRMKRLDLTERELQVLQLLTEGKTNKEISATLFVSEDTVKTHVKGVFGKLEVKDRTEAAITAVRLGIVHLG